MVQQPNRDNAGIDGDWICVGSFGAPHGVRGAVRLKSFTEVAADIFAFADVRQGAGGKPVRFTKERATNDGFVVRVDGINSPEAAGAIRNIQLYVHRDILPDADEDEYYLADLIGLEARDTAGVRIGVVSAVENFGAEDLIELVLDEAIKGLGRYAFIPFRKILVTAVDIAGGTVSIDMALWQETQTGKFAESQMEQDVTP